MDCLSSIVLLIGWRVMPQLNVQCGIWVGFYVSVSGKVSMVFSHGTLCACVNGIYFIVQEA